MISVTGASELMVVMPLLLKRIPILASRFCSRTLFPLTPALSLRERVHARPSFPKSIAGGLVVLSIIVCGVNASGASPTLLKRVQTISLAGVKGRFDHFAVDVKGQRVFV